jgi:hypothetical protein
MDIHHAFLKTSIHLEKLETRYQYIPLWFTCTRIFTSILTSIYLYWVVVEVEVWITYRYL